MTPEREPQPASKPSGELAPARREVLFGLNFNLIDREQLRAWLRGLLDSGARGRRIAFSNPEFVLEALKNPALRSYLNGCDLNVIDGVGVLLAFRYVKGMRPPERLTGTHFMALMCEESAATGARIFLFGGKPGIAQKARERLEHDFPGVQICGALDGYEGAARAVQEINAARTDVLVVCLGNPRQEQWIEANHHLLDVKLAFGNGGALDFWAGEVPMAPALVQRAGFEWLFRLVTNFSSTRLRRQARLLRFVQLMLREGREGRA